MSKIEKQRAKLVQRIADLEGDLRLALQKKSSSAREIDVPGKTRQLAQLRADLVALK
jgi:hypothetical protein